MSPLLLQLTCSGPETASALESLLAPPSPPRPTLEPVVARPAPPAPDDQYRKLAWRRAAAVPS